jgi:2-haloacid dehalogenase
VRISVRVFCLSLASFFAASAAAGDASPSRIKVVAFDAFPIFDPRPIAKSVEEAFPGQGAKLWDTWRSRLFEYQWLRALGGRYEDFMTAAEHGLVFSAKQQGLALTAEKQARLLDGFRNLKPWPDAAASISALRVEGVELIFLSNMTEAILRDGLRNAGLEKEFKAVLSTDAIHSYKPDPKAYALAMQRLGVKKDEILFVAFAGWDVAGAKWFGYPTYWVNRAGSQVEELGAHADGESRDLAGLVEFVKANRVR